MNKPRTRDAVEQILDLARWAPSGDNAQPWRFQRLGERQFRMYVYDTSAECLYDRSGKASMLAAGALIESAKLAARPLGYRLNVEQVDGPGVDGSGARLLLQAALEPVEVHSDPLAEVIERRATQRRPLSPRDLRGEDRTALQTVLPTGYRVVWFRGARAKWRVARLLWRNAYVRLTAPETYRVHRDAIEWGAQYSKDRIPDAAVGMDPVGLRLMRWAMRSWNRVRFLNRYVAGTWLPRIQLDFLPALLCGAHFVLIAPLRPRADSDFLDAGRAVQRFWLEATHRGLHIQPSYTPLVFRDYVRAGERFTQDERAWRQAAEVADAVEHLLGRPTAEQAVFMGRIGYGRSPSARSTRLDLSELLID